MKKYFLLLSALFAVSMLLLAACGTNNSSGQSIQGLTLIASYGSGKLYLTNTTTGDAQIYILQLNGSFESMGRQYGHLMSSQLATIYDQTMVIMEGKGLSYSSIEAIAEYYYGMENPQFKDVMDGMAETSGLSLEALKIISGNLTTLQVYGCSMISAWGDYTTDGTLYLGRNWDLYKNTFVPFAPDMMIVVYNPTDSIHSVADINFCGNFLPQTCLNSAGVFIELNNAFMSSSAADPSGRWPTFQFFPWLLSCSNLTELVASMDAFASVGPAILNIADIHHTYSYELAAYQHENRIATQEGLITATNDYIDPRWTNLPVIGTGDAYCWTRERRNNLYQFGTQNKGSITATAIKQILDTTITEGGATFADNYPSLQTYYQVVAIPASKQIWFKFRGYSGWEFISLDKLFTKQ